MREASWDKGGKETRTSGHFRTGHRSAVLTQRKSAQSFLWSLQEDMRRHIQIKAWDRRLHAARSAGILLLLPQTNLLDVALLTFPWEFLFQFYGAGHYYFQHRALPVYNPEPCFLSLLPPDTMSPIGWTLHIALDSITACDGPTAPCDWYKNPASSS